MTYGATILGCAATGLSPREAAFYRESAPFGFILFGRNIETPEQVLRLCGDLRESVGRDAPILIDQEGGRVQRMRAPHWREWLAPLDQMESVVPEDAARAVWLRYRLIAAELRAVGIDANCAPLADVASAETHPFLRNRCFGESPEVVTEAARACAEGLLQGGVLPVVKHLPGHGRATMDSHKALPRVGCSIDELARDFAPFAALKDLPMGMTAHIVFEAIDVDLPATQSKAAIEVIRNLIGFEGLLMSDDLSMQALSGSMGERSAASVAAGCDVVLHCNGNLDEMQQVVPAAGRMTDPATQRANAALARRQSPGRVDLAALEAELAALVRDRARV